MKPDHYNSSLEITPAFPEVNVRASIGLFWLFTAARAALWPKSNRDVQQGAREAVLTHVGARNRVLTVVPDRLPPPAALCDRGTGTAGAPAKAAAAEPLRQDSSSSPSVRPRDAPDRSPGNHH